MQQNSPVRLRTEHDVRNIKQVRYDKRITVGKGLCLFVTPKGGRCWHYRFQFSRKRKKLNLGTYPEISLECAKARHQYARNLLAHGINPCEMKATLGKNAFVLQMREWEMARGQIDLSDPTMEALRTPCCGGVTANGGMSAESCSRYIVK